jgi:hypothetical protein
MISTKTFLHVAGAIFSIVGALHLLRLLTGFPIVLGGWILPVWLSIFGVVFPWFLAFNAFTLAKKNK